MNNNVVLVDIHDNAIGIMDKIEAHEKGLLHRAFSIFIFNEKGELLLQQRAYQKYHSAGLWSNTCCSHPFPEESIEDAVKRRLQEEMGIQCQMKSAFHFIYQTTLDNGLIEHEFDHVFIGYSNQEPMINEQEVNAWVYIQTDDLMSDIELNPNRYTVWLKKSINQVLQYHHNNHSQKI